MVSLDEWEYLRKIENNVRMITRPLYMVSYCTADGLMPGFVRLNESSLDFYTIIPNPFEGIILIN